MQLTTAEFRVRLREALHSAFGGRFRRAILYGSEARGDANEHSDIDVMLLLAPPVDHFVDARIAIRAISDLRMEVVEHPIHVEPVDEEVFERAEYARYRNAKREGVQL